MRRLAVGCFLVLVVLPRPTAQPAGGPIDAAAVQELLAKFQVPGVSIAVVKDCKIEWAKGYGVADAETGAPVTNDTLFTPRVIPQRSSTHTCYLRPLAWKLSSIPAMNAFTTVEG